MGRREHNLSDVLKHEIVAAYKAGMTITDICDKFGVGRGTPSKLAKDAGLPPRGNRGGHGEYGGTTPPHVVKEIRQLYRRVGRYRMSLKAIARKCEVTVSTVTKYTMEMSRRQRGRWKDAT